jgi:hypothetical protein
MKTICYCKDFYSNVQGSIIHSSLKMEVILISINRWIWYSHTMENYLATWKNEPLIGAATWINHKTIKLRERLQTKAATYCMTTFRWNIQRMEIYRDRNHSSDCLDWDLLWKHLEELGIDGNFLKLNSDHGTTLSID